MKELRTFETTYLTKACALYRKDRNLDLVDELDHTQSKNMFLEKETK